MYCANCQVRVFDLAELSLKFERRLDCECVDFKILSDDYSKLVFLQADRTVEFHAAYGRHFSTRVNALNLIIEPALGGIFLKELL
jgi:hypothetical protein